MKLILAPSCRCSTPYDRILAITDSGQVYCASCQTKERAEKPHVFYVPEEIAEIVTGITSIADLNIKEIRQYNSGGFRSDRQTTRIKAKTHDFSGECVLEWYTEKFPAPAHIRTECNNLRGNKINLMALPTAITPELRKFLELLKRNAFLVTQIVPSDQNTQRMYLECWCGPNMTPGVEHEQLVVRLELAFSMNIADGIGKALGSLNTYNMGTRTGSLPYSDAARQPLQASKEVNFALPSMCVRLLNMPYEYAIGKLAADKPEYFEELLKRFPEMAEVIRRGHTQALKGNRETWGQLSCEENTGLTHVCMYAQYHLQVISDRIGEVRASVDESAKLSKQRPPRIEELDFTSGMKEIAKPHYDFIDAVYSLFLRIPAQVIKMEAAARVTT